MWLIGLVSILSKSPSGSSEPLTCFFQASGVATAALKQLLTKVFRLEGPLLGGSHKTTTYGVYGVILGLYRTYIGVILG